MFDPITYFQGLTNSLTLTKDKFKFDTISGVFELEGIIQNRKRHQYFVAVDDSENGVTQQGEGRGYWERRPHTVFLCAVAKMGDMEQRKVLLAELRQVYRAFLSKIIKDKSEDVSIYFNTKRIPFYEIPGFFADGCVGVYFILSVDNSINLCYDPELWT